MFKNRAKGFTLIELLVVIAIIGILASIVMVSVGSSKSKSRDSKRVADIKNIQLALSLYYNDNGFYPLNIYAASNAVAGSSASNGLAPAYLPVMPRDPQATGSEACTGTSANSSSNQGCYRYNVYSITGTICTAASNPPVIYHLGAAMEEPGNSSTVQDVDANSGVTNINALAQRCTNSPTPNVAFDGNATGCNGTTAASPDACYDVTN